MMWAFAGQFVSFTATLGSAAIVARLLSPTEMGIFALAMATVALISGLSTTGINTYVIREHHLSLSVRDTAFTINALLGLILFAVIFITGTLSHHLFDDPGVGVVLRLLAVMPVIQALEFHPSVMLQRDMRFQSVAVAAMLRAVTLAGVTIVLVLQGHSYLSMAYGNIAAALVSLLTLTILGRRHVRLGVGLRNWRPITQFGARILSISGLAIITQRLTEIIMGKLLGLAPLGLYSRASMVANLLFDNIYGTATRVIFAQMSKEVRDGTDIRYRYLQAAELLLAIMWPMQLGLAILSGPVIRLLFGESWLAAAPALSVLMIAQFIVLGFAMNWELFVMFDQTRRQTRLELARAVAGLGAFAVGCLFSLTAAAGGRVVEALVGLALYRGAMNRLVGATVREVVGVYLRSLRLSAITVAPALTLMIASNWASEVSPWLLLASILLAALGWLLTMRVTGHPLWAEISDLWTRLVSQR